MQELAARLALPLLLNGLPMGLWFVVGLALALLVGQAPDGAALSVQLVTALGQDWELLRVAKRLERLLSGA